MRTTTGRGASRTADPVLPAMFDRLRRAYGPQNWWPARTATEVVVGAILTQNTAWRNVEWAIRELRAAGCLSFRSLRRISEVRLAGLIRSSGTFRVKARRLKEWVNYLWSYHRGSLDSLLAGPIEEVRWRLQSIPGIGPETADAILLYAAHRPTFVVDAYTRRVLRRHYVIAPTLNEYEAIRRLFHRSLPNEARLFNEFHALLVQVGKRHCRARAVCEGCPLADMPHDANR